MVRGGRAQTLSVMWSETRDSLFRGAHLVSEGGKLTVENHDLLLLLGLDPLNLRVLLQVKWMSKALVNSHLLDTPQGTRRTKVPSPKLLPSNPVPPKPPPKPLPPKFLPLAILPPAAPAWQKPLVHLPAREVEMLLLSPTLQRILES